MNNIFAGEWEMSKRVNDARREVQRNRLAKIATAPYGTAPARSSVRSLWKSLARLSAQALAAIRSAISGSKPQVQCC